MKYSKSVKIWLFIGILMVFVQVVVGGITRLTESGLSITKWEVVTGTLPPLSEEKWLEEFVRYKETPQYKEINEGMNISDFKFIYFWEYIHRLWARFMGFVFLIPFIFFLRKGLIDKSLLKDLLIVIFFAILAAMFGWIMVASGLIERPWVNAYKLSVHLLVAVCVFVSLLWTFLKVLDIRKYDGRVSKSILIVLNVLIVMITFQLLVGGVLSGMKAAVVYPTWPDMHGVYIPDILFQRDQWNIINFYNYDKNTFMPALIHFLHRNTGYLIFILGVYLSISLYKFRKQDGLKYINILPYLITGTILFQVLLGVITVINSVGTIPVLWGVLHQAGALVLIGVMVFSIFVLRIKK